MPCPKFRRPSLAAALLLAPAAALAGAGATAQPAGERSLGFEAAEEPADSADARAFRTSVLALFDNDRYQDLTAIADQAWRQRQRFQGGAWALHIFYGALSSPRSPTATDADWLALLAKLQRWAAAVPASATPRTALAQADVRFAWKARGHGYSDSVTPQGLALFVERTQAARSVLESAQNLSPVDPEWYLEMQRVALAQGWPRDRFDGLADQALAGDPGYFYLALSEANFLLPKWYGKPGDTELYAGQVADRVGGEAGDVVYFQIARAMNCCKQPQAPALLWARVRQGFTALETLYGSTNHERNVMAYLAVRAGDAATARQMFGRIGTDWSASVWKTQARYDAARELVEVLKFAPADN